MKRFDLVLFDLGATLIWFNGDWETSVREGIQSMQQTLVKLGYPLDDSFARKYRETAREYYRWRDDNLTETPAPEVFRRILAEFGHDALPREHVDAALTALYSATQSHWQPEEDALPTLEELRRRGYHIGLISNAGYDEDVQALIDRAGFRPYLEFILTSAAAGIRKPHPDIFEAALNHFGLPPARAVMVGDFLQADILGANRLGMGSVWITRRVDLLSSQPWLQRIQPNHTISTLGELPALLENWE